MGVVYSLYDALVSINVPDDKAKAVIDAIEREMMENLATKADLTHVKEILSKDMQSLEARLANTHKELSRDIAGVEERVTSALKTGMAELETRLTVRLGGITAGMITIAVALIGAVQFFR